MDAPRDEHCEDLWGYAKRLRFIRDTVAEAFETRRPSQLRLLDIGCGNGSQLTLPLALHGFEITGIDIDERSIRHAQSMSGGLTNVRFQQASPEDLSAEKPFDVVILSEVLEHTLEPRKLLAAAVGCMTLDGLLIVTVPNGHGEFEIDSWIFRKLRLQKIVNALVSEQEDLLPSTDNLESGHVQFFTRSRLRRLFDEYGLVTFREGAGSFLAGPTVGHLLGQSSRFIEWNARITDRLPLTMASAWYFALRRRSG